MSVLDFIFNPDATPEQRACTHYLSFRMRDGKHFCMSCRLVSELPLRGGEDA